MENEKVINLLGRIATALERIADSVETNKSTEGENFENSIAENIEILNDELIKGSEEENITNEEDAIEVFLNTINIRIKTIPPEDAADDVINSLSEYLGNNYSGLRELLAKIKRKMQKGEFLKLSMKEYLQKDISSVCQFCTKLHDIAFLEQYKYFKSPQYLINAKTTTLPTAQKFFSGQWLERYVLLSVCKAVNLVSRELDKELEFTYLLNPQISLPNGDDFELDLLFQVNGTFYWVEAKSGDYQQHISKYYKISQILNLNSEHSIMVLTDVSSDKLDALTKLFSMRVCSISQLEEILIETLNKDTIA